MANIVAGMSSERAMEIINDKYEKPGAGIPKSDLSTEVQESLGKADDSYSKSEIDDMLDDKVDEGGEASLSSITVGNTDDIYFSNLGDNLTYLLGEKQDNLVFKTPYSDEYNLAATMADVNALIDILCPKTTLTVELSNGIVIDDAINHSIVGYKIYGRSSQSSTPSPDNVAPIYDVGTQPEDSLKYNINIDMYKAVWDSIEQQWTKGEYVKTYIITLDQPLRGLLTNNEYIADYLEFTQNGAKVVRNIGINSYNQVYNKGIYTESGFGRYNLSTFDPQNVYSHTGLCNYFQYNETPNLGIERFTIGNNISASLFIKDTTLQKENPTADDATNWLKGLSPKLKIYYVLQTPIEEIVSDIPSIDLLSEPCILEIDNTDTPSKMEFTYYQDINKVISGL